MEVITLVGKQNSGKSTTLKELIMQICLPQSVIDIQSAYNFHSYIRKAYVQQSSLKACVDKYQDVSIAFTHNNKTIGITTLGDDVNKVANIANAMNGCDVFICASHPNHKLRMALEKQKVSFTNIEKVYAVKCESYVFNSKLAQCRTNVRQQTVNEIINLI
ncbi:MAG: hypothetical protein IKV74_07175 [Clostridia bacterium]|nr:hypothetical protein [Clostridia bacterium]